MVQPQKDTVEFQADSFVTVRAAQPSVASETVITTPAENPGDAATVTHVPIAKDSLNGTSPSQSTERIGPYEILGEIARGGMGVVYRARQIGVNRIVALKMMLSKHGMSAEERGRFQAEAEAAGQLDHPHIVAIYDVGEDDGRPYIAMAFVEGSSLKQLLADGPLSPRRAASLMEKISSAVHYAHTRGIIHRDLKPANVLIDTSGEPRVTDFGLAKKTVGDSGLTATGQILGTPSFMPPEQASGNDEVGVVADVYSLGATLYCLLTGRPPFQAAGVMETLHQVIHMEPVSLRQWNPQLPLDLETICLKCLAKSPGDRYPDAATLAEELRRFLAGEPIQARPVGGFERSWRWARRRPTEAGLLVMSILALVATAVVGASLTYQSRLSGSLAETERQKGVAETQRTEAQKQRQLADQEKIKANQEQVKAERERVKADELRGVADSLRTKAESERGLAVAARQDADEQRKRAEHQKEQVRRYLYLSQIRVAKQNWEDAALTQMGEVLESVRPSNSAEDLRGFEWYYLQRLRHGFDFRRLPSIGGLSGLALSANGRWLATCGGDKQVRVWDLETNQERWIRKLERAPTVVLWDREGQQLFAGLDDGRLVQLGADGQTIRESASLGGAIGRMSRTRDGKFLAAAMSNSHAAVIQTDTLALVRAWPVPGLSAGGAGGICFSLDEQQIYTHTAAGKHVECWNVSDGTLASPLPGPLDGGAYLYRHPEGDRLIAALANPTHVAMWDLKQKELIGNFPGNRRRIEDLAITPDGKTLVTSGNDTTVRLWHPDLHESGRIFRGHTNVANRVAISPDGKRVISSDYGGGLLEWNLDADSQSMRLGGHEGYVYRTAYSPDGKVLATSSHDRKIRLWNSSTGVLIRTLVGHTDQAEGLVFSVDGQILYSSSNDKTIRVWNLAAESEPLVWTGHTGWIWEIALSPDGKWLASVSHDQTVRLWDTASGECTRIWQEHTSQVMDVVWDRHRNQILSASMDGTVRAWSPDSAQSIWTLKTGERSVDVSPDGRLLAVPGSIIDYETKKVLHWLRGGYGGIYRVRFSPDGRRVADCGVDSALRLWDCELGQEILRMHHDSTVFDLSFRPDGRQIATASRDGTARIWDASDP